MYDELKKMSKEELIVLLKDKMESNDYRLNSFEIKSTEKINFFERVFQSIQSINCFNKSYFKKIKH